MDQLVGGLVLGVDAAPAQVTRQTQLVLSWGTEEAACERSHFRQVLRRLLCTDVECYVLM